MEQCDAKHKKYYTSPLSDSEVDELAKQAITGECPTMRDISGADASRVLGAAAMMLRERRLRNGQNSKPMKNHKPVIAGNIAPLSMPNGDYLLWNILTSMEMQLVFQILGAALSELSRVYYQDIGYGARRGWGSSDSGQAHYLFQYLQQKALGVPILNARGIRTGWSYPATELEPNARKLVTPLRIWANSLSRTQAQEWLAAGQPWIKAHLGEIADAGRLIHTIYGAAFRAIGCRLDAATIEPLFALPGLYVEAPPPEPEFQFAEDGLPHSEENRDSPGPSRPQSP